MESLVWSNRRILAAFWLIAVVSGVVITLLLLFFRIEKTVNGRLIIGEYETSELLVNSADINLFKTGNELTVIFDNLAETGTISRIHYETEAHLVVLTMSGFKLQLAPKTELGVKIILATSTLWETVFSKVSLN